jgi:hypothetical protein
MPHQGASARRRLGAGTAPRWLKLSRVGQTITASASLDGRTWTVVGRDTFTMPSTVFVGLAASSHDVTRLATGTFANVAISTASGWRSQDIGAVGQLGSASESAGVFTVRGAGADIWTLVGRDTFTMPSSVLVGLAATSNDVNRLATGTFAHVALSTPPAIALDPPLTVDGIGAAQGAEVRDGKVYLYGDASTGVIREYDVQDNRSLLYTGRQIRLVASGRDVVSHPTGLTTAPGIGTLIGTTVSQQGTLYFIDWARALAAGTLEGAIQATIADDLAVNGTRPEFVRLGDRWLVATADYGSVGNEIRLYDPARLAAAARTSEPGVLVTRFRSSPLVQTLHWLDEPGLLVLVQNRGWAAGWRLTVIDLARSVQAGAQVVTFTVDLPPPDELEGFHMVAPGRGLFVTSSAASNVYFANVRLY